MPEEELGGMEGMRLFVHTDHFKELNLGFALDEGIGNGFHHYYTYILSAGLSLSLLLANPGEDFPLFYRE